MNYEDFLSVCPDIPVYYQSWFWEAMCLGEWDAVVVEWGGQAAAALPYTLRHKWGWTFLEKAPAGQYAGVWIAPQFRSEKMHLKLCQAVIRALPKHAYFLQNFHTSFLNWLPFYWEGFQQTTRYTYLIDLEQSTSELLANFCTDYRNNKIPKAAKSLQLRTDLPVSTFYQLVCQTYERQGIDNPLKLTQLAQLHRASKKHNSGTILYAVDAQGVVHAGLFLLWDQHTAYDFLSADNPEHRSSGASVWLVWQALLFAQQKGLKTFDFVGSMKKSIERVRRNFGARPHPYFQIFKHRHVLLSLLMTLRRFKD